MTNSSSRQHDGITRTCETCGHCGLERTDYPCRSCIRTHGQADMYELDESRVEKAARLREDIYEHVAAVWSRYLDGVTIDADDVAVLLMIVDEVTRREEMKHI